MSISLLQTEIQEYITARLSAQYPPGEAAGLARLLAEHLAASHADHWQEEAEACLARLSQGEPVQYITGYSWFYDLKLRVAPAVLIPRPETEELVDWIIREYRANDAISILDIGTGSGCIALALKKHLPVAHVTALDISVDALRIAQWNAEHESVQLDFLQLDILRDRLPQKYDVIVSNPPYVSHEEFLDLSAQVRDHEPAIALSPVEDDPLIFYRRIAGLGREYLHADGEMYLELNEFRADAIRALFMDTGYATDLRMDLQGKWRMMMAIPKS